MMMQHRWTALVTILALLVYFWMSFQVAGSRRTSGISAPTMTGETVESMMAAIAYLVPAVQGRIAEDIAGSDEAFAELMKYC